MDQTRFVTLQKGIEVASDLVLPEAERRNKGESFALSLVVAIPWADGSEKPLDIIVDRVSTRQPPGHTLANGDIVVDTIARLQTNGTPFKISLMFHLELMRADGAEVRVSKDMERIIFARLAQNIDRLLEP